MGIVKRVPLNKDDKKIKQSNIREENDIFKMNSHKNGKQYLESISFSIPTNDFFTVVDSCHFNHFEDFCPILT